MKGKMRTLKRSRKSREEILLNNEKFKISRKKERTGFEKAASKKGYGGVKRALQ